MPGLDWDLNLDPDPYLQAVARQLSFSPSSASFLPSIPEGSEGQAPETPVVLTSQCTAPPSSPVTPSGTLYPAPGATPPPPPTGASFTTSLALAPRAPSRSQQPQEAVASARMAEAGASLGEYQRQRQAALQQQQLRAWEEAAARSRSQQLSLFTVEGGPAGYETKWEELHPVSQGLLLQIEDKMREYKYESELLDQCSHLHDPSLYNKSFELDASQTTQEAGSISTIIHGEKVSIKSLMDVVKEIMWNTDFAIRSYVKLRPRFVHRSAESANAGYANHSGSSGAHSDFSQLLIMAPTFHCCSGAPRRPSPFVLHTLARFEDHLGECCKWILELEQLVQVKNDKTFAESLSKVMSNVHDYLIHVASKVEHIHQYVEIMKTKYLNDRRRRGDSSDPFLEADRREAAKQEPTARIVHPMLHLSPPDQPATPVAAPMIASQLQKTSFPTVAAFPSSCPTLLLPSVLPPSSTQKSPAQSTNPFSSSWSVLQSTPFGSASTLTLGSTPATFMCRTSIPSSATSLFPAPSGGGTTASGITRCGTKPPRRRR